MLVVLVSWGLKLDRITMVPLAEAEIGLARTYRNDLALQVRDSVGTLLSAVLSPWPSSIRHTH